MHSLDPDNPDKPTKAKVAGKIDTTALIDLMARASRLPDEHISGHAFETLATMAETKEREILQNTNAVRCLIGHLRDSELVTRMDACRALQL